ncbi:hypothetical protein Tco_1255618 [Tanacetum coccineum]
MFENNVPTTKRVLVKKLQHFLSFLYAHLSEDNWVKHEEATASYADLRVAVEGFTTEADNNRNNYDIVINSVMEKQSDDPPQTTPNDNRENGKSRDTNEYPRKLVPSSKEIHPDPDTLKIDQAKQACAGQSGWGSVHQREHLAKVKKSNKLRKKRYNQYVWTTTNRLKPEKITDTHIYPNTKPVAITVYRNNDQRNFENKVVGELMTSLSKKYDMIPVEIRISPTLPPTEQPFLSHVERKEIVETPEHVIFFTDALDEHAFQRVSAIHNVEVETLLGYLVMAGNVNNLNNQRFYVLLRQMIDAHHDREKLKSKKVKLEVIRYSFN